MVKDGGSEDEAKTLADEFQAVLLDVMFEAREIKEENDIIRAKALPGTKKKEPANLPHEFVTNDDFCPGLRRSSSRACRPSAATCGRTSFQRRHLRRASTPRQARRRQARPARLPRLGARALARRATGATTSRTCAKTSKAMRKALPPRSTPTCTA